MAVRFYLNRRKGTTGPVGIALVAIRNYRQIKVMTTFRVGASDWLKKQQKLRSKAPDALETNAELARLKAEAERLMLRYPSDDELREALLRLVGRGEPEEVVDTDPLILDQYALFKAEKEPRVRENTRKIYNTLENKLTAWRPKARVSEIGPGWLTDFSTYLIGEGLNNSTVNKLAARCGSFLRWMEAREVIAKAPRTKPLPEAKNPALFLTVEEVNRLRNVDLSRCPKGWQAARDLFLIGVYTGQRYGDIQKMTWTDIRGKWWHLTPEKTTKPLLVPIDGPVREIIESRKGKKTPVPRLTNQRCNEYLKEIAQLAEIDAPVTVWTLKGGNREREDWPKWQVLTTHTARKTHITLSLQSGASIADLLNYTHSDLRSLRAYMGSDLKAQEERVRKLADVIGGGAANG